MLCIICTVKLAFIRRRPTAAGWCQNDDCPAWCAYTEDWEERSCRLQFSKVTRDAKFNRLHFFSMHGNMPIITYVDGSGGSRVFIAACLCVCFFLHDISKTDAARITNLTYKCSTTSHGNPFILRSFILRSKYQRSRSRVTKAVLAWLGLCTVVSAGFC